MLERKRAEVNVLSFELNARSNLLLSRDSLLFKGAKANTSVSLGDFEKASAMHSRTDTGDTSKSQNYCSMIDI